jgi:hypothetical protein
MATLLGVLILVAPFGAFAGLVWVLEQHQARRHAEIARQVALTDALHARLGALLAPVVHRRERRWRVEVAVPFEHPDVAAAVLTTADAVFGGACYELVIRRQSPEASNVRARRPVTLGRESLSWS